MGRKLRLHSRKNYARSKLKKPTGRPPRKQTNVVQREAQDILEENQHEAAEQDAVQQAQTDQVGYHCTGFCVFTRNFFVGSVIMLSS
jgi:hypothetical protein